MQSQFANVTRQTNSSISHFVETVGSINFRLVLRYCEVDLCFAIQCTPFGIDMTPLDPGLAVFADAYEFLTLDSIPSLRSWTPSDPQGLQTVCIEIRGAISRHQRKLIEHHPLKSVSFKKLYLSYVF